MLVTNVSFRSETMNRGGLNGVRLGSCSDGVLCRGVCRLRRHLLLEPGRDGEGRPSRDGLRRAHGRRHGDRVGDADDPRRVRPVRRDVAVAHLAPLPPSDVRRPGVSVCKIFDNI